MADFLHNNDDILMKYLDGEMDREEKALFEEQLETNASLKERLQNLQLAAAAVRQYGTTEAVRSVHSEMMKELSPSAKETKLVPMKKIIRYSLAVAASIIIILVGINLFSTPKLSSEALYKEAFVDYDASGVRGAGTESEIIALYQGNNYKEITERSGSQNLTQEDSLLVGLSFLKLDNASAAVNWLKAVSAQSPVKEDADYYLSLAYLKNKNYDQAVELMERIRSNRNHVYHNQFSEDYIDKVKRLGSK